KTRSMASRMSLAAAAVVLMGVLGFVIIQVDEGGGNPLASIRVQEHLSNGTPAAGREIDKPRENSKSFWSKIDGGGEELEKLQEETRSLRAGELASADQLARNRQMAERRAN